MRERDHLRWRDRLGVRLGVAFTVTALAAVAIVTVVALTASSTGVSQLAAEQRAATARNVVATLESAYLAADGWVEADLLPAHTLAAAAGAVLVVTTPDRGELPTPPELGTTRRRLGHGEPGPAVDEDGPTEGASEDDRVRRRRHDEEDPAAAVTAGVRSAAITLTAADGAEPEVDQRIALPIVVDEVTVGSATLLFVDRDVTDPATAFQAGLLSRLLLGAGTAALLALLVTAFVTSRLTRPLRRLTHDLDRLRRGVPIEGGAPLPSEPGEIGVLREALDAMGAALLRQERLRRALVADVGHELRTPVTILLAELEAIRDGVLTADDEELGSLHEEVQRIARLVEDVASLSDAEAAGFALERRSLDLGAVTEAAARGLEAPLRSGGRTLALALQPVEVVGDRRRLEQVVRNLLTNAARFAPDRTTVEVAVRTEGDDAILEVRDRGPGFPPDELPHVFERFWRGHRAEGTGGSGIGLAVVAEVVAAHGGSVTAVNRAGGGAQLTVRLPRSGAEPAAGGTMPTWGHRGDAPAGSGPRRPSAGPLASP
jgi:two-component system, OmpR family, sensor histidine kinase BaeS